MPVCFADSTPVMARERSNLFEHISGNDEESGQIASMCRHPHSCRALLTGAIRRRALQPVCHHRNGQIGVKRCAASVPPPNCGPLNGHNWAGLMSCAPPLCSRWSEDGEKRSCRWVSLTGAFRAVAKTLFDLFPEAGRPGIRFRRSETRQAR